MTNSTFGNKEKSIEVFRMPESRKVAKVLQAFRALRNSSAGFTHACNKLDIPRGPMRMLVHKEISQVAPHLLKQPRP